MSLDSTWQQCLSEHPLLLPSAFKSSGRSCIEQHEGDLFLWRNEEKHLCYINIKRLQSHVQSGGKDAASLVDYQTLVCSQVPQFQVKSLRFSPSGQFVALVGEKQLMFVQLPTARGQLGRFGDGRKEVSCRSFNLAERLLSASGHVRLLQLRWHPASYSETHVLLLTSDNIIRLYCFSKPQRSLQTYAIAPGNTSFQDCSKSGVYDTTRAISMANTECVVDFDVLPDRSVKVATQSAQDNRCCVFALMDSGDVYLLRSVLPEAVNGPQPSRPSVIGPLRMVPAAEDNYGVDSCAMCCLDSYPPGLVVATTEGRLYHCVIMADEGDSDDTYGDLGNTAQNASQWQTGCAHDEPVLCVFEGVALALSDDSLDDGAAEQSARADNSSHVSLHHVGDSTDRYFCSHSSGIHSVILPWLRRMDRFCVEGDDREDDRGIDELNIQEQCHVEHLISSRPFKDSPACPLASFCTVNHPYLGHAVVCLTDDGVCSTVDLRRPATSASSTSDESTETVGRPAVDATLASSPFVAEVRSMMAERSTVPVVRLSTNSTQLSEKGCAELLDKATNAFSGQIPIMRKVAAVIAKRAKSLSVQREHQRRECSAILHQFDEVKGVQADVDQQAQSLLQKHEDLTQRLFAVFHALEFQAPVRSVAEEQMAESLQSLSADMKKSQQLLGMVRQKSNFHKTGDGGAATELSDHHQRTIRSLLKQDTDDIEQLVTQVKSLHLQTS